MQLDENEKKQLAKIVREGRNVFSPPYDIPLYDMKKKPRSEQLYGSEQMLRSLLETFLIELVRKHVYYKNEDELGERDLLFDEILSYVDAHFTDKITLDELAFMFNTNRSAFCQRFKALTGYTLVEYIAQKKVARIKKLLTETDRSVSEISNELNFESVAYLCRFSKSTRDRHRRNTEKRLEKREAALMVVDNSLSLQFAYLDRETAAIDLKEVGKLLAVIRNVKAAFAAFGRLNHQILHKLISGGALGHYLYPLVKRNRLAREVMHEIVYHFPVKFAVSLAGMDDPLPLKKQDLTRLV